MSFAKKKRAEEALDAILSAIDEIGEFIGGKDLLDGTAERRPEIPWKQVRDMRHRIAHEYLSVDFRLVWDVATADLAPLRLALLKERDYLTSC